MTDRDLKPENMLEADDRLFSGLSNGTNQPMPDITLDDVLAALAETVAGSALF